MLNSKPYNEFNSTKGFLDYIETNDPDGLLEFCNNKLSVIKESINVPIDLLGNTALHYAVSSNDFVLVTALLQRGADPNVSNKANVNSIRIARRLNLPLMVALLLRFAGERTAEEIELEQEDCLVLPESEATKLFTEAVSSIGSESNTPTSGYGSSSGTFSLEKSSADSTPATSSPFTEKLASAPQSAAALADMNLFGQPKLSLGSLIPKSLEQRLVKLFASKVVPPAKPVDEQILLLCELFKERQPSFLDAFYLRIVDDVYPDWRQLPREVLDEADPSGQTALMKASFQGYFELVRDLCSLNVHINQTDLQGRTALFWACTAGRVEIAEFLLKIYQANPNGFPLSSDSSVVIYTPLAAAIYRQEKQSLALVQLLLKHNVDVHQFFGPKRNKTALMLAAWLQKSEIVHLILASSVSPLPEAVKRTDLWLKQGFIYAKRIQSDAMVWQSDGTAASPKSDDVNTTASQYYTTNKQLHSLKERVMNFTAGENNYIKTMGSLISSHIYHPVPIDHKIPDTTSTLCTDTSESVPHLRTMSRQRQRLSVSASSGSDFRQGLNLDKIFGTRMDLIKDIAEKVPERGTKLTLFYLQVYQCLVYLVIAANKNIKHRYVAIAAKANFYALEIIRQIDIFEGQDTANTRNKRTTSADDSKSTATLSTYTLVKQRINLLSRTLEQDYYKKLMLATRIAIGVWPPANAISDMLAAASVIARTCRDLVTLANLTGFWPIIPIKFEFQMSLSDNNSSFDESLGNNGEENSVKSQSSVDSPYFGGLPKSGVIAENVQDAYLPMLNLSFAEYKRQNDFKQLEMLSKSIENDSDSTSAANSLKFKSISSSAVISASGANELLDSLNKQKAPKLQRMGNSLVGFGDRKEDIMDCNESLEPLWKKCDERLKSFVRTVQQLKVANDEYCKSGKPALIADEKDRLLTLAKSVHAAAENIVKEIFSDALFAEIPDTASLTRSNIEALKGDVPLALESTLVKPFLKTLADEVHTAGRDVLIKGKLAAGVWPPPDTVQQLMSSSFTCAVAVRMFVSASKVCGSRLHDLNSMDSKRKEKQKRDVLNNEKVKNLFKLWEEQQDDTSAKDITSPVNQGAPGMLSASKGSPIAAPGNEWLVDSPDGVVLSGNTVKGGTLQGLIEYATGLNVPAQTRSDFAFDLLLTHHSFSTSLEILDCLARRYLCAIPQGLDQQQFELFKQEKQQKVRQQVANLLKEWINWFSEEDIVDNEPLVFRIKEFADKWVRVEFPVLASQILQLLSDKFSVPKGSVASSRKAEAILGRFPPKPILPKQYVNPNSPELLAFLVEKNSNFMEIDPLEFARQLTLIEMEDFQKVKLHECLDQIWLERKQREVAARGGTTNATHSNIQRMIRHTNGVSMWIANSILDETNLKARANVLKYFCQVAIYCREFNNFNGITTIVGGLSIAPVKRLVRTWNLLSKKHGKIFEQYQEASDSISPKSQYAMYRKVLKNITTPAIPFLGVYLTDLTFIELGNLDYPPNQPHLINMDKRSKVAAIIKQLQHFQSTCTYNFTPVTGVQELINQLANPSNQSSFLADANLLQKTEEQLYEQSVMIEPKVEKDDSDDSE